MRFGNTVIVLTLAAMCAPLAAQPAGPLHGLRAMVRPISRHVPIGHPVRVSFLIENTTGEVITLTVPGTQPQIPPPEMGLPLVHVFSGGNDSGVSITTPSGRHWDKPVGFRRPDDAPILMLAPHSAVGTTIDVRDFFPALRVAGKYRITWRPYGGGIESESAVISIAPRKQVQIKTDEGPLTIELYYDDAPDHVENFLQLAGTGFYTNLTFHRLEPGYMMQGGCPRGDGTGVRSDGKRIAAELNRRPHQRGSVSMALLDDDADSASCQFFISYTRQKSWDGHYTVFGHLTGDESYATLDRLMAVPVDEFGRPRRTLYMRSVRMLDAPVTQPGGFP